VFDVLLSRLSVLSLVIFVALLAVLFGLQVWCLTVRSDVTARLPRSLLIVIRWLAYLGGRGQMG
jgi:hypothetical protein